MATAKIKIKKPNFRTPGWHQFPTGTFFAVDNDPETLWIRTPSGRTSLTSGSYAEAKSVDSTLMYTIRKEPFEVIPQD